MFAFNIISFFYKCRMYVISTSNTKVYLSFLIFNFHTFVYDFRNSAWRYYVICVTSSYIFII